MHTTPSCSTVLKNSIHVLTLLLFLVFNWFSTWCQKVRDFEQNKIGMDMFVWTWGVVKYSEEFSTHIFLFLRWRNRQSVDGWIGFSNDNKIKKITTNSLQHENSRLTTSSVIYWKYFERSSRNRVFISEYINFCSY